VRSERDPDWLRTFLPLGVFEDEERWTPVGAGVLFADLPLVWLITARSVLDEAAGRPFAAWLGDEDFFRFDGALRASGLEWVRHEEHDLAVCPFPLAPEWNLRAFTEANTIFLDAAAPGVQVQTVACPFGAPGLRPDGPPPPFLWQGALTGVVGERLYSTAPLLTQSAGSPLLAATATESGRTVSFLGVVTESVLLPDPHPATPPLRLSGAVSAQAAVALIRSEAGKAQRRVALSAHAEGA